MKQIVDTRREGVLASFIFVLWLMTVVFPPLKINIFSPANELAPSLYLLAALYLIINGCAFLYALYMLIVLARTGGRRKGSGNLGWRILLYLYAVIGLSIAIYSAAHAIL